jgi:hypothetical protein
MYDSFVSLYRVIINYCPIAVGVENPHKFWMCRSLATLDKLVDRFPLPRLVELTNLYSRLPR